MKMIPQGSKGHAEVRTLHSVSTGSQDLRGGFYEDSFGDVEFLLDFCCILLYLILVMMTSIKLEEDAWQVKDFLSQPSLVSTTSTRFMIMMNMTIMMIMVIMLSGQGGGADNTFVKHFTQPDFRSRNFTH